MNGRSGAAAVQEIGIDVALSFHRYQSAVFSMKNIAKHRGGLLGDMDAIGLAVTFQPAGHINRVTPDVVDELVGADDACGDGTGVDDNANFKVGVEGVIHLIQC